MEGDPAEAVAALVHLTASADPATRLQALSHLHELGQFPDQHGHVDQDTILSALRGAVADADRAIQRYAIEALAGWDGPDARASLHQALQDPDPAVRTTVIEQVALQGHNVQLGNIKKNGFWMASGRPSTSAPCPR